MKKHLKINDYFYTSDLALVAALVSWNFPIESIDKTDPKKALFAFKKTTQLEDHVQSYWNDTKFVSPKRYFSVIKEVKTRIYQE